MPLPKLATFEGSVMNKKVESGQVLILRLSFWFDGIIDGLVEAVKGTVCCSPDSLKWFEKFLRTPRRSNSD